MQKIFVLYHAHCTDGFGAAFSAWLKFKNKATYIAVSYDAPVPKIPLRSKVYLIDFCYNSATVEDMNKKYDLTILDHHVSAEESVKKASNYVFDLKKSGASLAWDYFHPKKKNQFIKHIEDKDLWKFSNPKTKSIIAALESYPRNFKVWSKISKDLSVLNKQGKLILQKQAIEVELACGNHYFKDIGGYFVPVVNTPNYMSDIAEYLLIKYPDTLFVGVYYEYIKDGQKYRRWSLRSRKKGLDVSKVAAIFGGGGHKTASGFYERIYE
jgi:uncharacterized protein